MTYKPSLTSLGEDFRRRQGSKWGTHTLKLENLAAELGQNRGADLAWELEQTGHQMAGLLETFSKDPDLRFTRSYEHGNPRRGAASGQARKALGLDTIDPTLTRRINL